MERPPLKVLLVEDDEDDYVLIREALAKIGPAHVALDWVSTYDAAAAAMARGGHDVFLVDYRLGGHDGLELLQEPLTNGTPVIVLTGQDDPAIDLRAMRAGAAEYLVKGQFSPQTLFRAIRYAAEKGRVEEALRQAHRELERRVEERTAELVRANEALRRHQEKLRLADRRKDEFLAILSHELRNPLAAIRNSVDLVRISENSEALGWSQEVIEGQIDQVVRLVDDLLDVSRISEGKIQLRKEVTDVAEILARAQTTVAPRAELKKHDLRITLPAEPLLLEADPARMEQILVNLLSNAIKYTDPGGAVDVSTRREADQAVISVRDSGVGIPSEMLGEVFQLFAQVNGAGGHSQGGLGIGLALVKSLVEMHGGTVSAASAGLGRGSEFTVRLPLLSPKSSVSRAAKVESNGHAVATPLRCRVLVVDDSPQNVRGMVRLIKVSGHESASALDGPTAIEVAKTFQPEVVLLDIGLPGMDGYEVASEIRRIPGLENVKLVAVSGYGQDKDRIRSSAAGFDHHLVKPVSWDQVSTLIAPREKA